MNVLCDDFASFSNTDEINQEISTILDEDEDFLKDIQDQLTEAYQKIGIKPNEGIVTKLQAPILALIIANPIVSMGLVGVTLADCVTALCGLKFSIFNKLKDETTKVIDSIQKDVLLNRPQTREEALQRNASRLGGKDYDEKIDNLNTATLNAIVPENQNDMKLKEVFDEKAKGF